MRNLFRFVAISRILARYRLDALILSTPLLKSLKPLLYITPWYYFPVKKYTRAQRIRLALEELGPIFIKFGQTISTRRDLLPEDIADELAKLQDKCPEFSTTQAKQIIESALGGKIDNFFTNFDDKPLAAASIAQVHTANTLDGAEVIIKVVRPEIEKLIQRDINLLYSLAKLASRNDDIKRLRPVDAVKEFERIIFNELNMMAEAASASLLRRNFIDSDMLYVPKINWDLTKVNILVMERIYGTPISDIKTLKSNNVDFKELAENGVKIFFTQVFKHNFFHADMHPGNIFVGANGKYIGVDFGIMGSLSEADKYYLAESFMAFFNQDYKRVAQIHLDSGWAPDDVNVVEFEAAIRTVCEPLSEKTLENISFGQVLLGLFKEAKRFNISIQPQLLLLDKTLLNIEGLGRQLYPQLDLWATAKPFLEDMAKESNNLKQTFAKFKDTAPQLIKELPQLPQLTIDALKQISNTKHIESLNKQQTNAIIKQLQANSKHQTIAILFGTVLIVAAMLAVKFL